MKLAEDLINNYSEVVKKVDAAIKCNVKGLTQAVVEYVNSLPELTKDQVRNLVTFLERQDVPPLVRVDCIQELSRGPARGRLGSTKLMMQLAQASELIGKRKSVRIAELRGLKFCKKSELPEFLTHKDTVVVEAAKKRFAYLESFPEKRLALQREMEIKESRDRLARSGQELLSLAKHCSGDTKDEMLRCAKDKIAASSTSDEEKLFERYEYYFGRKDT